MGLADRVRPEPSAQVGDPLGHVGVLDLGDRPAAEGGLDVLPRVAVAGPGCRPEVADPRALVFTPDRRQRDSTPLRIDPVAASTLRENLPLVLSRFRSAGEGARPESTVRRGSARGRSRSRPSAPDARSSRPTPAHLGLVDPRQDVVGVKAPMLAELERRWPTAPDSPVVHGRDGHVAQFGDVPHGHQRGELPHGLSQCPHFLSAGWFSDRLLAGRGVPERIRDSAAERTASAASAIER